MLTKKDYCDYDTCVAFEELGFPIKRIKVKGEEKHVPILLYEAQKWLREKKNIIVSVYYYSKTDKYNEHWYWILYQNGHEKDISGILGATYEEALLEGIKESIKILKDDRKQFLELENTEYDYGHNVYHEEL